MTLDEWVAKYEKKTGEQFVVPDGFKLAFDEQHGFFCFTVAFKDGIEYVDIAHTCVDSFKWAFDIVESFAKANGIKYMATATKRNPKAYARLTGATRKPEYDYDGYKVFVKEVT